MSFVNKKTRNILIGLGAAAAAAVAAAGVSYAVTKELVKVALDRQQPKKASEKSKTMLMGAPLEEGFACKMSEGAALLLNTPHKTVEITGHDGARLVGHWFECENPGRTVIAMHGWRSSWNNDFGMIAPFFKEQGCNVLFAEQRAQGQSGGKYLGFGLLERYDCLDWINWAVAKGNYPIYLAGVSMGATTVLMTSGFKLPERVKGIIADCGFTSPEDIWRHVAENNIRLSYHGLRSAVVDELCMQRLNMLPDDCSTITALKKNKVPVLFVHGADDHFVPVEMTYKNYLACAAPKKLLIVPGADHGMSYYTDKALYEKAIIELFESGE